MRESTSFTSITSTQILTLPYDSSRFHDVRFYRLTFGSADSDGALLQVDLARPILTKEFSYTGLGTGTTRTSGDYSYLRGTTRTSGGLLV